MALGSHPLASQSVGDIVRFDRTTVQILADHGIGPAFVGSSLESAVRAAGADLDSVVRALIARFARQRQGVWATGS